MYGLEIYGQTQKKKGGISSKVFLTVHILSLRVATESIFKIQIIKK